ncbi:MAG: type II toxin-antitoxin system prevent-host-death family antitoxin [Acidimicrobiales bacterium]|jgi:prevent-host-death family protein|nr:type II toxin-antitoxin system prevent-host-death family antitoxin [Acidimicrobiales bacterium]
MEIGIRELRADLAAVVRRAGAGESVVVTVSGRPVARLGPVDTPDPSPGLDQLVAVGAVIPPRVRPDDRPVARARIPVDARPERELRKVRG